MLPALKELLDNSLNTLGIANSDDLVNYCLVRTLTDIKTIKSIIIDSTLLRRYSKNVFGSSIRYNYVENHKKIISRANKLLYF